jgi:FlaA1/EpsC-like NDP-sugar epimerase
MIALTKRRRRALLWLFHAVTIGLSLVISFLLRFDFSVPPREIPLLYRALLVALPVKLAAFYLARLDRGWWRFAGMDDLYRVILANVGASLAFTTAVALLIGPQFPRSVYLIDLLLCFVATAGARFAVRLYYDAVAQDVSLSGSRGVLVYGAGAAGVTLAREIRTNPRLGYRVLGFLDDDTNKRGAILLGVPVLGAGREAPVIVDRYARRRPRVDEIIIAMPSATGRQMQEALANCRAAGVACKTVPGIAELLNRKELASQIRNLSVTDLLGREPIHLDEGLIRHNIAGRSVLVTGGAGSIGSEICRQVARFGPRRLVVLDQAESELFRIDLLLREQFPQVPVFVEVADVRDRRGIEDVIRRHLVDSVFHAAAYKHVPLMEAHLFEAVRNNVLGTWNLVQAAYQNRVSDFLMISSDKAVNPINVMGATKRVAELLVSALPAGNDQSGTKFVSVRFGNVLGSNGSVVPLFQAQIAAGGPVTVTHPEARRYFMTVREAVQLVLQASTMGKGSEIFVLDMGEPIKIVDLARNMIRLSGLRPDEDIEIRFIGLRPGEKIYEELITEGESILPTYHDKIKIFQGPPVRLDRIEAWLPELEELLDRRDEAALVAHLRQLAPEYQPGPGLQAAIAPDPRPAPQAGAL